MLYANWANNKDVAENLEKINMKGEIKESGLPIMYNENDLFINPNRGHNLIIGSTCSGKTQAVILPMLKLSIKANESFFIYDINGSIYKNVSGNLKENNYKVVALDFNKGLVGNNWNPLYQAYNFYKNNDLDQAINELENISYYLFHKNVGENDFWINSACDYFVGIAMYIFKNDKEYPITLESVYNLGNDVDDKHSDFLKKLAKNSSEFYYLNGALKAPVDTRGGIIATFNQGLKKYIAKNNLASMLKTTDFDFKSISKEKIAVFIFSGINNTYDDLIPLFVNQLINTIPDDNKKKFNILLDDFDNLLPINNFAKLINYAKNKKIEITVAIKSFTDLENIYGLDQANILKMCFANMVYLLSNDLKTLEEISRMCGKKSNNELLINVEELKTLKFFEAIIIMIRMQPLKTKLIPDYKLNLLDTKEEVSLAKRLNTTF